MQYKVVKGLTNFNFGRVLFGTEYSITFMNTYNNFTIYKESVITEHALELDVVTTDPNDTAYAIEGTIDLST
jgi:hypothetical protein